MLPASLISHPKEASLVSPEAGAFECITHAFSGSTPEEGIESTLVHMPAPPSDVHAGLEGLVEEYRRIGVKGKISIIR